MVTAIMVVAAGMAGAISIGAVFTGVSITMATAIGVPESPARWSAVWLRGL